MRDLDTLVLIGAGIFAVVYVLPIFGQARAYAAAVDPWYGRPATKSSKAPAVSKGMNGANPWNCIGHKERLKVVKDPATIEGVVIAGGDGKPHWAPDGDLVFPLKPDPAYANMVNDVNIKSKKYQGGIWVEAICQHANKATETKHQGDCAAGCGAPTFPTPKVGDHLRITGAYVIDVGEDSHTEMHPVYTMEKI